MPGENKRRTGGRRISTGYRPRQYGGKPLTGQTGTSQPLNIETLRNSKERVLLHTLQKKISMAPPVDRHPPERLGDFLPEWFKKNVTRSGDLLATVSETLREQLPQQLMKSIALGPLQRGHLTIYCSSSPAKMELDAQLRRTLLQNLQIATKGLIFRVKTMVDRELINY